MADPMERPQVYVRQLVDEAVEANFAEMQKRIDLLERQVEAVMRNAAAQRNASNNS